MKKYLSVIMLLSQACILRILALLAIMTAAEAGMFYLAMGPAPVAKQLETVISDSRLQFIFLAAFLCMIIILGGALTGKKSMSRYTLHRLRISERQLFFCEALFYASCFLLLLAAQAAVLLLLGNFYMNAADPALISVQTLVLAAYRSPFFHSILPLSDWVLGLRNLVLVTSLGICTAHALWSSRRGRGGILFAVLTASAVILFIQPVAASVHVIFLCYCLGCSIIALMKVFEKEEDDHED